MSPWGLGLRNRDTHDKLLNLTQLVLCHLFCDTDTGISSIEI